MSAPGESSGAACAAAGIVFTERPDDLWRIREPGVDLVLWDRSLPRALSDWLEAMPAERLPDSRVLAASVDVRRAAASMLDGEELVEGDLRSAFLNDLVVLAGLFLDVMESDAVDIRLDAIDHDACWKFHRDYVAARMLTTYRGAGTQWVRPQYDAAALAAQGDYSGPVEQFARHTVGLFKGDRGEDSLGTVHRSPPIEGTGETRLLLCLNLPSEASPPLWRPSKKRRLKRLSASPS